MDLYIHSRTRFHGAGTLPLLVPSYVGMTTLSGRDKYCIIPVFECFS
jgi:hypothetical protein